jgi:hypothetical protein
MYPKLIIKVLYESPKPGELNKKKLTHFYMLDHELLTDKNLLCN